MVLLLNCWSCPSSQGNLNQLVILTYTVHVVLSVMAAKGVTDFTYLLNPPLSVGCSIDGFIKMVRKVFTHDTDL